MLEFRNDGRICAVAWERALSLCDDLGYESHGKYRREFARYFLEMIARFNSLFLLLDYLSGSLKGICYVILGG